MLSRFVRFRDPLSPFSSGRYPAIEVHRLARRGVTETCSLGQIPITQHAFQGIGGQSSASTTSSARCPSTSNAGSTSSTQRARTPSPSLPSPLSRTPGRPASSSTGRVDQRPVVPLPVWRAVAPLRPVAPFARRCRSCGCQQLASRHGGPWRSSSPDCGAWQLLPTQDRVRAGGLPVGMADGRFEQRFFGDDHDDLYLANRPASACARSPTSVRSPRAWSRL